MLVMLYRQKGRVRLVSRDEVPVLTRCLDVVAALIIKDSLFLCTQRRPGGETGGLWEFPGGKIEPGESREEALIREIGEELSVAIQVDGFFISVQHQYSDFLLNMHVYYARILHGVPVLQEHQALKWLPAESLPELDWAPADLPVVHSLVRRVKLDPFRKDTAPVPRDPPEPFAKR